MDRDTTIDGGHEVLDEAAGRDVIGAGVTGRRAPAPQSPVMAWNEWDPLEEVIVGSLDGATIPTHHLTVIFNLPRAAQPFYRLASGWKYPKFMKKLAQAGVSSTTAS